MDYNKIREIESKHYMPVFSRMPVAFTHGKGCKLYDTQGTEYTDFWSGIAVSSLGHGDEGLVRAISEQAARLIHISNLYYSPVQAEFIDLLLDGTDFSRVFLSNSGAEANECAIKLVRKYYNSRGLNRNVIVSCNNSFHGRTLATLAATGQSKFSENLQPMPTGFKHIPYNDISALKNALTDDVGALMLEIIQGEGGVVKIDYEFATMAYTLCKAKDILLVIDEVQTGAGRTGAFFCYQHLGILPDIVTLAKGLGGGMPIGATLARGEVATIFAHGDHGSTFGGNPLACAAAKEVVSRLKGGLLSEIEKKGEYLSNALVKLTKSGLVKDVRGKGLLIGVELLGVSNVDIVRKLFLNHFLVGTAGQNTVRIAPPFVVSYEEIDAFAAAFKDALESAAV